MNKKLIAAAVSAAVVAPVASQADMTVYGRVNNAIDLNGLSVDNPVTAADEGASLTDVSNVSSRFGLKGNADIGNGLTAHGQYEFATVTDKEQPGIADIRVATVGVSGAFGRIDIGNQWSAYFNTFGTLVSPTYSLGYYLYSSVGGGPFRGSNTIKYSNSFGPLSAQLDIRLNDDKKLGSSIENNDNAEKIRGDGWGLGLSFAVNDNITIAAAYDEDQRPDGSAITDIALTADDVANDGVVARFDNSGGDADDVTEATVDRDETRMGIAVKANFGSYWVSAGWQNREVDNSRDISLSGFTNLEDSDATTVLADRTSVDGAILENLSDDIDTTFIYGGGSLGEKTSWLFGYSQADDDGSIPTWTDNDDVVHVYTGERDNSTQLTWGVYHNLGGGLKLYYEATDVDSENTAKDGARHLLGMRVDF
ncbi:MAG: porin [bacterium]